MSEGKPNICFDCQLAAGRCPWSAYDPIEGKIRYDPVPGWTAEPAVIFNGYGDGMKSETDTWRITACPLFVPDPPRKSSRAELKPGQFLSGRAGRVKLEERDKT